MKKKTDNIWKSFRSVKIALLTLFLITVLFSSTASAKAASIKLNKKSTTLYTNGTKTVQLKATVTGTSKKVTWKSSNKSVATVSSSGKVTAKRAGTATITATANGKKASCKITVKTAKSSENLSSYKLILNEENPVKTGNITFSIKYNSARNYYTVYMTKGGKKSALVNCTGSVVTNGTYLYYGTGTYLRSGSFGNIYSNKAVYRLTISSKQKKKLCSCGKEEEGVSMIACDGRYLYFGYNTQYSGLLNSLTTYDMNAKTSVCSDIKADKIQAVSGRLLVSATSYTEAHSSYGAGAYLMSRNGKVLKSLSDHSVLSVNIKGKYIYFTERKGDVVTGIYIQKCRCSLSGTNKKVLQKWTRID